jgi:hypothetical protein
VCGEIGSPPINQSVFALKRNAKAFSDWNGMACALGEAGLLAALTPESTSVNEQSNVKHQTQAPDHPDEDEAKVRDDQTADKDIAPAPENSCSLQLERFHSS